MKRMTPSILVVDDEASIRRTLEGVFRDEQFDTILAPDGKTALALLESSAPSLVLLDIWMPEMDGIETLKRIKERYPTLPVVMISGHASIATAMEAARLGAADFIEKPLDLPTILRVVRGVLEPVEGRGREPNGVKEREETPFLIGRGTTLPRRFSPVVFDQQPFRGRRIPQRTLRSSTLLYGQGLHSGKKSGLILEPLPPGSGIHFAGVSGVDSVPAHVDFVQSTGFATTIRFGETRIGTIEHLMSSLHAYGIANLLIKCNGEVPVMDGSSREFCALFDEVGVEEQEGEWYAIRIPHTIQIGNKREFIRFEPGDGFTIDYTLSYPEPVGVQHMVFTLGDRERYVEEIAPARTFGLVKDIGALHRQGLALGGRFDNFVLVGEKGPINDALRFPDEFVRHKILDAIGDLYLLGRTFEGRVVARMTGHSDNIALLKALREAMVAAVMPATKMDRVAGMEGVVENG